MGEILSKEAACLPKFHYFSTASRNIFSWMYWVGNRTEQKQQDREQTAGDTVRTSAQWKVERLLVHGCLKAKTAQKPQLWLEQRAGETCFFAQMRKWKVPGISGAGDGQISLITETFVLPLQTQWRGFQIRALDKCSCSPAAVQHHERKQIYK